MEQFNGNMDIITRLRQNILQWEGYKAPVSGKHCAFGLGLIENAFPHQTFPSGAIHEFLCGRDYQTSASCGFLCGLLKQLMLQGGYSIWISSKRNIYPPALKQFGLDPGRILFIDLDREKEILWVMEECLRSQGVKAVVAELRDLNFTQSRRLQLAVEASHVTGFILRDDQQKISSTASAARWRIKPLPSNLEEGLPGVGFPRWKVELLKVRNGNPGVWEVEWSGNEFHILSQDTVRTLDQSRKVG